MMSQSPSIIYRFRGHSDIRFNSDYIASNSLLDIVILITYLPLAHVPRSGVNLMQLVLIALGLTSPAVSYWLCERAQPCGHAGWA